MLLQAQCVLIHGGRINFARALVEISSDTGLKQELIMVILVENEIGYTKEIITIEYGWKPPHCVDCKVFGALQCKLP